MKITLKQLFQFERRYFINMNLKECLKKQGGLRLLVQYWKGGALFTGICEFLLLGKSRTALEILRLSTNLKIKQKIFKKYRYKVKQFDSEFLEEKSIENRKIWVCWMQGIECAPQIVKRCYQSLKDNICDREIVLITEKNYKKYVEFPQIIQNKIDKNIIKGAHMSDLLRLELLDRYGGTWIDATVYCSSSNIPDYMLNSDLFLFQCLKPGRDGHATIISNWFITAKPHHRFIFLVKELLYEYWKEKDELVDYFIFHDFFQLIIENYPEEWSKVIPFSNAVPHILLLRLFEKYDEAIWNAVVEMTPFHKLSYKFGDSEFNKVDTFYQKIIRG